MRFQSSKTRNFYELDYSQKYCVCPECGNDRKKKGLKNLQMYEETSTAYCHHCQTTFFLYNPHNKEKSYVVPEWKNKTDLTDKAVKWFEGRGINQQSLVKMKIYSDKEYMPQYKKEIEVICYPYFVNDKLVNIKYRGANKSFKFIPGAELVFYNYNALLTNKEIIVCEGENDCLAWVTCGKDNVVSVPNGSQKKLEYLDACFDLFNAMEKIYLSTDNDSKGIELRDELIRRFGVEKCWLLNFKECKDANDYLLKYGGIELLKTLDEAKQKQIDGIITVDDMYNDLHAYFEQGDKKGTPINVSAVDEFITWQTGRLAIETGIPGSGKSEFIDWIITKLNIIHGWKAAYFTPENYPMVYHYEKIYEKLIGKKFSTKYCQEFEFDMAYDYIKDNFYYILPEEETTLQMILDRAKWLVRCRGVKVLVLDPYNKIEHLYDKDTSETKYISKFLDKIITFAKINDVLVFLVAHPTKMQPGEIPTLYSISGSANFYNKTDYGFTVHRKPDENGLMSNTVLVHWQKIKYKNLGKQGVTKFIYNYVNGRFEVIANQNPNDDSSDINSWDNTNWLVPVEAVEPVRIQPNTNFDNERPSPDIVAGIDSDYKPNNEEVPF